MRQVASVKIVRRQSPYLSLATLRRSVRLTAFALAVFVLRLGMVAACEPSDLVELLSAHADEHALVSTLDASSDPVPGSPEPNLACCALLSTSPRQGVISSPPCRPTTSRMRARSWIGPLAIDGWRHRVGQCLRRTARQSQRARTTGE